MPGCRLRRWVAGHRVALSAPVWSSATIRAMGQPVTVIEKQSSTPGVCRFETNRALTGTGHEHYSADSEVRGERPPDLVARRLFERGGVDRVHVNSNVITVELARGADTEGIAEIIGDLYTYYRPGIPVPTPEDFAAKK